MNNSTDDPTQAKADGPAGIRVPFLTGEGEVRTHFVNEDGVPMVSTSKSVLQQVADWRADNLKLPPADQESVASVVARASGLNTSVGDQAKKAKLGDEPAKTALPDTQKQLAATLGTISRELAAKPPQPSTPPANPAVDPANAAAPAPAGAAAPAAPQAAPAAQPSAAPGGEQQPASQHAHPRRKAQQPRMQRSSLANWSPLASRSKRKTSSAWPTRRAR